MRYREEKCFISVKEELANCKYKTALSNKELEFIQESFCEAQPNEASAFPDYDAANAVIELFLITSSLEKKKYGAAQQKEIQDFHRAVEMEEKRIIAERQTIPREQWKQHGWKFKKPIHSHEYLIQSLKKNWENHIHSLRKSEIRDKKVIFVIEYVDDELLFADSKIMEEPYDILEDKKALEYLYENSNGVDYVVFKTQSGISVFDPKQQKTMMDKHIRSRGASRGYGIILTKGTIKWFK